ncbi:MAG: hypothetical protein LRS41_03855 [Caldisphaeraceae archaeon]|nr:hypothetical protein [Caldisphaeraceae archaeon]
MKISTRKLLIASIVIIAIALPILYLNFFTIRPRRDTLTVYSVYPKHGDPQIINASYSIWVFYPTENGTIFQSVFNGTGKIVNIRMSSLIKWAKSWIRYYGRDAIFSFMPSIIIFSSYETDPNNTVEIVTQEEMIPLNLSYPITGKGFVIKVNFTNPFITKIKSSKINTIKLDEKLGGLLPQTTTTETTMTPTASTSTIYRYNYWSYYLVFRPKVISWYPSNNSLAPISLAISLAKPNGYSPFATLSTTIVLGGSYFKEESFNAVSIASNAFLSAVGDAESNEVASAINSLSPTIPGASLTFTQVSEVSSTNRTDVSTPIHTPDVGQIYVMGQAALINWTIYNSLNQPVGWELGMQLTALKVVKSNGAIAPVLYKWLAYDPCVNITQWAEEYYNIKYNNGNIPPTVINATCPIPNTPAPVNWEDYEHNLTYLTTVNSGVEKFVLSYVNIEGNSGQSAIGAVIDAGSALASTVGIAALASGIGAPVSSVAFVVSAILNSVQFTSHSVTLLITLVHVDNQLPVSVSVYYSNMTPLYTYEGQKYTLPRFLVLINATS